MKGEIDALLRMQIVAEVKKVMTEVLEKNREEWVTGDQLSKQFAFFTAHWLRTYGQLLPRERVGVVMSDNNEHKTSWCYPLHRIQRMIEEGKLRHLVMIEGKGRSKRYQECFPTIRELETINQ